MGAALRVPLETAADWPTALRRFLPPVRRAESDAAVVVPTTLLASSLSTSPESGQKKESPAVGGGDGAGVVDGDLLMDHADEPLLVDAGVAVVEGVEGVRLFAADAGGTVAFDEVRRLRLFWIGLQKEPFCCAPTLQKYTGSFKAHTPRYDAGV